MALPLFYKEDITTDALVLDEDTSKHVTGVLRMKVGESILLTDGRGSKATAVITDDHRKRCAVRLIQREKEERKSSGVAIAISLVKNAARFEWFLEKATEIGVAEIIPLLCQRTEKEKFREERWQQIITSAMLQSQQVWMPCLHAPTLFEKVMAESRQQHKFVAHCLLQQKQALTQFQIKEEQSAIILIGPEGDFTEKEIEAALQNGFAPVALGNTRLRTETAGMVAAALLCMRS
jgi:16S rRNA (uracil1498-N3)-methyltransferase